MAEALCEAARSGSWGPESAVREEKGGEGCEKHTFLWSWKNSAESLINDGFPITSQPQKQKKVPRNVLS